METIHPLRSWRRREGEWSAREGERLSLTQLARLVGVGQTHLSQVETGHRGMSLDLANRLSDMTGIPIKRFVREVPK